MKRILVVAGATASYTVLAGIAFGFLNTGLITILIMVGCFSVICIVAGMYTGYHFGYEQKTKVYIVGAILFLDSWDRRVRKNLCTILFKGKSQKCGFFLYL